MPPDEACVSKPVPVVSDCRLHLYGHVAHCLVQFSVVDGQHDASFHGGIFLVFSFFKFLDAPGFASAFKMYDPLAKAIPGWSWIYPYVELLLGVAYMMSWQPLATNVTTLVLMSVGGGVLQSLLQKLAPFGVLAWGLR